MSSDKKDTDAKQSFNEMMMSTFSHKHNITSTDQVKWFLSLTPIFIGMTIYRSSGITEIIRYILDPNVPGEFILFNPRMFPEIRDEIIISMYKTPFDCAVVAFYMDLTEYQVAQLVTRNRINNQKQSIPSHLISFDDVVGDR